MNINQRILISIIRTLEFILYWRVKSSLMNHTNELKSINPDIPVFFVTRYRSITDALVVEKECKQAKLQTPLSRFEHNYKGETLNFWNRLIPLTRPGITEISSKSPRFFSKKLQSLIQQTLDEPDFDVQLVPASVFWGRSPRIEGSFWQAMFSDSWSIPGFFRKFLMVLIKGRQTYVQLGAPFSLRQIIGKETDDQRAAAKTHRVIRRRMRMQREAFIGPDLSHRRTLILSILATPHIRLKIEREAKAHDQSVDAIHRKAFGYCNEIAADYSHTVIRSLHVLLKCLWTKLYDGVQVQGGDRLRELAQEHAIVYVPSHRSHIDYLLLSFVLYDRLELVPPHIAAGVNLNLPIIGPILRRGGAFFMRRTFRDNPLYAAIFSEYLHRVLDRGFSIEYFIEGGRSRTGRQLPPKPGMLSMTLESYNTSTHRPLVFVPVNFCYERLFEGKSYLGELRGQKKRQETLIQFIKSLRRIKENFGEVHVTFGEPISADHFLSSEPLIKEQNMQFKDLSHAQQKLISLKLGYLISLKINGAAHAHSIALLGMVLHATAKHTIEEVLLQKALQICVRYLHDQPYGEYSSVTTLSPSAIIAYGERLDYICRHQSTLGDIIYATFKQSQYLSYFRNNIVHFMALPSLMCLVHRSNPGLDENALIKQVISFYPIIEAELFLPWTPECLEHRLKDTLKFLKNESILFSVKYQQIRDLLAGIIRPSLERYSILLNLLEKAGSGTLSPKELESQARLHAERISFLNQNKSPEFFDSKLFNCLVLQLIASQLVQQDDRSKLTFNQTLHHAARESEMLIFQNIDMDPWR